MMDLQEQVEHFVNVWGPDSRLEHINFLRELRELLEAYAKAALKHESLPDTEHKHGDPV